MARNLTHWYIRAGLFLLLSLVGCEQTAHITSGNINGLSIGMSKASAIIALSRQGVELVQPEVDKIITIDHSSIDRLDNLLNSDGLCIRSSKHSFHIAFDQKGNSSLVYSSANLDISQFFVQARTRDEAFAKLRLILQTQHDVIIANCILGPRYIRIKGPLPSDINELDRFDSWLYFLPHTYSSATMHFKDGQLESIDYIKRLHETP